MKLGGDENYYTGDKKRKNKTDTAVLGKISELKTFMSRVQRCL